MITVRKNYERGITELGWLHSKHTFSFADYYDACYQGVSTLRVINDDRVEPGKGFPTHTHQDIEIVSYVTEGTIEHKDNLGHVAKITAGEFQLMSAGTGITHSEYNASQTDPLRFLQIWITPHEMGATPSYQQKHFTREHGIQLIVSPDGRNGTMRIHQDASLYRVLLERNGRAFQEQIEGRTAYVHVVSGILDVEGKILKEGDGAVIQHVGLLRLRTDFGTEALFFDLP
jgi:redox-sensitive bicupin YhaK (pirin superfamily)